MLSARVLALFPILLFASQVQASDLVIGNVHLQLGMSKDAALSSLANEFEPKQVSAREGKYILWTKYRAGEISRSAGSVSFANGKLYRATKNWSDDLAGDETKMSSLFAVLAEVAGKSGRPSRVKAQTLRAEPVGNASGTEVRLITIELPPDREVLVQMNKYLPAPGQSPIFPSTSVEEILTDLSHSK